MSQDPTYQQPHHDPYAYRPPPRQPAWLYRSPRAMWVILGINVAVFLCWTLLLPANQGFLYDHFVTSYVHLTNLYVWTLLTSAFSHQASFHLLFNMLVLYSFGGVMERFLGVRRFLVFYVVAAVVSSLAHCLTSAFVIGEPATGAVGASGALAGLLMLFAFIFPTQKILLFGFIPIPAWLAVALLAAFDIFGLIAQNRGGGLPIGHAAHLGGAVTGLAYYFIYLRKKLVRVG